MGNSSTISSKGQVTVPAEIRNRLGLSSGDRVEFVVEGEHTIIRPLRSKKRIRSRSRLAFWVTSRAEKRKSTIGSAICEARICKTRLSPTASEDCARYQCSLRPVVTRTAGFSNFLEAGGFVF
jgi:AbrB family looped-hinge helix DNA binding protein